MHSMIGIFSMFIITHLLVKVSIHVYRKSVSVPCFLHIMFRHRVFLGYSCLEALISVLSELLMTNS